MHSRGIICIVALVVVELINSGVTVNKPAAPSPFESSGYPTLVRLKREHNPEGNEIAKPSVNSTSNGAKEVESSSPSSTTSNNSGTETVKIKTLVIPDRSPANLTATQMKEDFGEDDGDKSTSEAMPGDTFDEKAVQRAIIVIAGIAVIVVAYLGIKFALVKKRKVVKRYGRLESSEMDLLDQIEDEESEEEEELFDITQHNQRRS
ncbi:hypothetical protein Ocin01_07754 [Orchesella cincta]|uniref:Uncharacterized protein n=1 Tax=Orchesella cincta TaxID=48709 RepID=A0A1D2N105_ORCCI|nr:hypothetical protein Ocin01_07754 [Orchesella cincta]